MRKFGLIIVLILLVLLATLPGCRDTSPTVSTPAPPSVAVPALITPEVPEPPIPNPPVKIFVVPAITDNKILPDTPIPLNYQANFISLAACPGESEPASFAVYAMENITGMEIKPGRLVSTRSFIPAENVDIRTIKVWWQAGNGEDVCCDDLHGKFLTPELLLKDDSLVQVFEEENYLKLINGTLVWISERKPVQISPMPISTMPVRDSPTLLPVNIPAASNKQFWVNVKVPEGQPPGVYSGVISLRSSLGVLANIELQVEVLPINLAQPYLMYSLYYAGQLDSRWPQGSVSDRFKSEEQYAAEMKDLVEHGVRYPTISGNTDINMLIRELAIRARNGVINQPLFIMNSVGNSTTADDLAALRRDILEIMQALSPFGADDIYFYGIDEAEGEVLKSQRAAWNTVRTLGAKIFVAGAKTVTFQAMGDILDLMIVSGVPSADESAKWHSMGHKVFSYANPQVGVEKPETYRRNYGLLLWQQDYDGAMNFAYQWSAQTNVWNDFDNSTYRDHNFTYPTQNGVIDTIQWEGWREGVEDIRYLTTLLNTIQTAKSRGVDTSFTESWLSVLKKSNLELRNLDAIRATMISHILSLQHQIGEGG